MKFIFTKKFRSLYKKLPSVIQKKFDKQLVLLEGNFYHPSLHAKKIQGTTVIWEARVDYHYRFSFTLKDEIATLRVIGNHDDVLKNP